MRTRDIGGGNMLEVDLIKKSFFIETSEKKQNLTGFAMNMHWVCMIKLGIQQNLRIIEIIGVFQK